MIGLWIYFEGQVDRAYWQILSGIWDKGVDFDFSLTHCHASVVPVTWSESWWRKEEKFSLCLSEFLAATSVIKDRFTRGKQTEAY